MEAKRRLPAAIIGLAVFVGLGVKDAGEFWTETWFFVGLGMALSATFVEPYFSRPQDAIVNALAGAGVFFAVERDPVEPLWIAYLAVMLAVALAGLVATLTAEGPGLLKWSSFRISSRFGRAVVVGTTALLLIVLTEAASDQDGFEWLAGGTAALVAALAVDWPSILSQVMQRQEAATALAAIGPRMLLASAAATTNLHEGDAVDLESGGQSTSGSIVARLPHRDGLRYQIALASDWSDVCDRFPGGITLRPTQHRAPVLGAVGPGSTHLRLEFEPFRPIDIGTPVSLQQAGRLLLYQVARLELVKSSWAGAEAVVSHATAQVVGWPGDDGIITGGSHLPQPHDLIFSAEGLERPPPDGFYEIGRIKNTAIPVALRVDDQRRGHIAILGMTGMGKTAVAQKICRTLGENNVVVALDTTGEYASRLDFPIHDGNLLAPGYSVHEPVGDPPRRASEFITSCMEAGAAEYVDEDLEVVSRVVLLEEAHTFVPEWNFALRNQQDFVALSTRAIMQARKYGITFVIVSQRTAVVSKSALSQCENYIILRTIDQTSLDYLESVVGHEMRAAIPSLERFDAICVGPAFNTEEPVIATLSPP